LLSSDNRLVEKILFSSLVLFIVFVALSYVTVIKTFRPINELIKQANFLKEQDFNSAMSVVYNNGDEIEVLSRAYSEAGKTIQLFVEGLEREVKLRTEQYEKAAQEALDATEKKSTLLSNVSHEIRTPLNAIIGYVHMLKKDRCGDGCKHELDGIASASKTILDIVNDLLDFERLDSVNYTLRPKYVSISKLTKDIERTFVPLATQKKLVFNVVTTSIGGSDRLFVDELRFQQAISNIVSNAIKFTDNGEINVSIGIDVFQGNRMIVFAVRDTGRGIRQEDLGSIFNSFEQANQADKQFGFGLGLAITKAIVNMMDGTLLVESDLTKGSTFKIGLPFNLLTCDDQETSLQEIGGGLTSSSSVSQDESNFQGIKALVVDDVEFNREILQYHLKEQGIECITAVDGIDALQKLKYHSFDVILTDVSMPRMDGVELVQESKALFPAIPVIAVTARATVQEEDKMSHHFDNYITKPINVVELMTALSLTLHN
ncbi:ATP-binding protein, partial [Vibrio owensii]|uniref:ATP-binding protein n=1 Tax=Vibrio owensii TaxID=696485 RepID=UPI003AAD15D0